MAKANYKDQIVMPYGASDPAFSESFRKDLADRQAYYQNQASALSSVEQHPIISALKGLVSYGPAGLAMPWINEQYANQRRSNAVKDWQTAYKDAVDQETKMRELRQSSNMGHAVYGALKNSGIAPPIEDNSLVSDEGAKNLLNGITGKDTYSDVNNDAFNGLARAWNAAHGIAQTVMAPKEPQLDGVQSTPSPQFNAGAQVQGQAPLRPAIYNNPELLKEGLKNNTEMLKSVFEHTPAYEKLPSDIAKSLQEIQNLVLTGQHTKAQTALTQLQAKWYGKKTQSEINRNNRPPAGGHAPQPTTASEMARMYKSGAFGPPGSPQALQAYRAALVNDPNGYETHTDYNRDPEGHVIGSTSRRVPIGATANPRFQSAPNQKPAGFKDFMKAASQ